MTTKPITAAGAERLRRELDRLKRIERPRVTKAIAEARAHGDLSENAEYHAAREEQSFLEGRIGMIEEALAGARIIDPAAVDADDRVVFGCTVELQHRERRLSFQIVGEIEADISAGRLSLASPIARALIGNSAGDSVEVRTPNGTDDIYEILAVRYINADED